MTDTTPPSSKPDAGSSQPTHDETDRLYRFRRLELTRLGAADLIKEVLASSRDPLKRNAIAEEVQRLHVARGGKRTRNLVMRVKKALRGLRELGEVEQPVPGYYSRANPDQQQLEMDDEEPSEGDEEDLEKRESEESSLLALTAECEIGEGPESVYVYYYKNDRELADLKGQSSWPCKIGFTATSVEERIVGQGAITAMHTPPVVGLIIRSPHGRQVERIIHDTLRLSGCSIEGASGAEWFNTSPGIIKSWFEAFTANLDLLIIEKPSSPS